MLNKFKRYLIDELRKKEGTARQLHVAVCKFSVWCESQHINPVTARYADLIAYMHHLEKKEKSIRTTNRHFGALRHYYNYLIELGKVKNNPAQSIIKSGERRRAVHSVFTREELNQLYLDLPESTDREIMLKCATGLMVHQGATTAELGRMLPEHINLSNGTVYLTGGSRSNSRELRLEPQQILLLSKYLDESRPDMMRRRKFTRMLFFTAEGSKNLNNTWYSLKHTLQLYQPRLTNLRELRTNVIVHWLKTENPIQVKYKAGHRYVSSTEFFQLGDVESLKEELESFFPNL
jgi:site-specific recombinase XerD